MIKHISILALALSLSVAATAQTDWSHTRLTTLDGLVDNSVRHIIQDRHGFIWMATLGGISRYDGYEFSNIVPESHNKIRHLHITADDLLLAWTYDDHFHCYDCRKGEFVSLGEGDGRLYTDALLARDGSFWLWGSTDGCLHARMRADRTLSIRFLGTPDGSLPSDKVLFVSEGADGHTYISTDKGLFTADNDTPKPADTRHAFIKHLVWMGNDVMVAKTGQVRMTTTSGQLTTLGEQTSLLREAETKGAFICENNLVTVGTEGCNFISLADGHRWREPSMADAFNCKTWKDDEDNVYIEDTYSNVWMSFADGKGGHHMPRPLLKTNDPDIRSRIYSQFTHIGGGRVMMSKYGAGLVMADTASMTEVEVMPHVGVIKCVMKDKDDGVWVSTNLTGLTHLDAPRTRSQRIWPTDGPTRSAIRLLKVMPDSAIAIGTRDGRLIVVNGKRNPDHKDRETIVAKSIGGFYCSMIDSRGRIWAGTHDLGLMMEDENGHIHQFRHSTTDTTCLTTDQIFALQEDRQGHIWVGTYGGGLQVVEEGPDGRISFRRITRGNVKDGLARIRCMAMEDDGRIWVGTGGGLMTLWPDSALNGLGSIKTYSMATGHMRSDEVRAVIIDSRGTCWAGECDEGFVKIDTKKRTFTHYGCKDGLPNNRVQAFAEDHDGNIWITTEYGLASMAPDSETLRALPLSRQPEHNIYAEGCAAILPDGRLLLAHMEGVVAMEPARMLQPSNEERTYITALHLDGADLLTTAYDNNVSLRHDQNTMEVSFSSLSLDDKHTTHFSTRMEPLDDTWSQPTTRNTLSFYKLPPGHYTLHVRSQSHDGEWGPETTLNIAIAPPAWRTWWAYTIYVALALLAAAIVAQIFWKMAFLRNRVKAESEMTELKLVFFTNISHEFRTPLTIIMGAAERLSEMIDLPAETRRHVEILDKSAKRLFNLVNELLEFRQMETGRLTLSLKPTDVLCFIDGISSVFADAAEQKNIAFFHDVRIGPLTAPLDREKVEKMLFNLLSNAFKYTPDGGRVTLVTSLDNSQTHIIIRVKDTGIGVPPERRADLFSRFSSATFSEESVGIGLTLTSELARVHKGEVRYEPNPDVGSTFSVILPIERKAYADEDFAEAQEQQHNQPDTKPAAIVSTDAEREALPMGDTTGRTILVVEDQEDIRTLIRNELEEHFDVLEARDGVEALEMARHHMPDLMICDVMMPRMDGMEATRRLKNDPLTAHIPVIMLTALTSDADNERGVECGADVYVGKPFSPRLLLAHCRNIIASREALCRRVAQQPGVVTVAEEKADPATLFVTALNDAIMSHIDDADLSVDSLSQQMGMGRTAFYAKVRNLTGYAPVEYVKVIRMKRAAELISTDPDKSVAEVAYAVGFNDPYYFSRCFKQHFGVPPTAYRNSPTAQR